MDISNVISLIRPNIQSLVPYSSARGEYTGNSDIFVDANENPYESEYNRYPDPLQKELKDVISGWRKIEKEKLFLGNGSDEIIDLIIRIFCQPQKENTITFNPTYGMYKVSADINDVKVRTFDLDEHFEFKKSELFDFFNPEDKVLFICSPNNPTGNSINHEDIIAIGKKFKGIIVVDEAYIDFSEAESATQLLDQMPQLIVLQTLSKAVGCAGLRIGLAWMHPELVTIFNKVKPPYNISSSSQKMAIQKLTDFSKIQNEISDIKDQRIILKKQLLKFGYIVKVFPSDGNFLLVKCRDAEKLYNYLVSNGIVVRNRSTQFGCKNCLRITIGTPKENQRIIDFLPFFN